METSVDTNHNYMSLYGQVVWRVLNFIVYCCSGRAVFNCIDYERGARNGEMVGIQFNSFEELEMTFGLSRLCVKHHIVSNLYQ